MNSLAKNITTAIHKWATEKFTEIRNDIAGVLTVADSGVSKATEAASAAATAQATADSAVSAAASAQSTADSAVSAAAAAQSTADSAKSSASNANRLIDSLGLVVVNGQVCQTFNI